MLTTNRPLFRKLNLLLASVLCLGIYFRCVNLDLKPYWHDEIFTSLRAAGYTLVEVQHDLFQGQVVSVADLLRYQRLSPDKNAIATVQSLAQEEPQHPPLYFLLMRIWAQWFGSSITAMRSLSVVVAILSIPLVYWLCLELFESRLVGWIASALFAISPIYIRFAQEARPYSLWVMIVLLSCIAILRAMRHGTKLNWGIYALTVAAGLYGHLFSILVFLGHGIYILVIERFRLSRTTIAYLLASMLGIVLFIPWILTLWANKDVSIATTDWTKVPLSLRALIKLWSLNLSHAFIAWPTQSNDLSIYLGLPILILVLIAAYYLWKQAPKRVWVFILMLMGITTVALFLPDLIWTGRRSTVDRYFLPVYLGIHLAVAYLLASQLTLNLKHSVRLKLWQIVTAVVISAGVFSGAIASQASTWWGWSQFDVEVSKIIARSPRPLVISEMPFGAVMPVSYRLQPDVKLMLVSDPSSLKIPDSFSDIFVYNPSDRLQRAIADQNMTAQKIYDFQENTLEISLHRLQPNALNTNAAAVQQPG